MESNTHVAAVAQGLLKANTRVASPTDPIFTSPTHVVAPNLGIKMPNTRVAARFAQKTPATTPALASDHQKRRHPRPIQPVTRLMFANRLISLTRVQGNLVVAVDSTRPDSAPFKLPTSLLPVIQSGIDTLEFGHTGPHQAEGNHAEASATARAAFDEFEAVLSMGYTGIQGIVGTDRLGIFTT
jgi:hypothetical protein